MKADEKVGALGRLAELSYQLGRAFVPGLASDLVVKRPLVDDLDRIDLEDGACSPVASSGDDARLIPAADRNRDCSLGDWIPKRFEKAHCAIVTGIASRRYR